MSTSKLQRYRRSLLGKPIIYLDIDGVLNNNNDFSRKHRALTGSDVMELGKINLLKKIIEATKAEVVLISTWRLTSRDRRAAFAILHSHDIFAHRTTPPEFADKVESIHKFMENHRTENYIIIEDDWIDFMHDFPSERLIKCYWMDGLVVDHVTQAIEVLNADE